MSAPDIIECDRCPATLYVGDGSLVEVGARVRSAGWTTPTPFTDRCPTCSPSETAHHPDARAVIARGICEWDDRYADFEGDDLARVALEALAEAGYVVVKQADR